MIQNYFDNVKGILGSLIPNAREAGMAGGQKGRGLGGRNFCPPVFRRRRNGVGKRFRNSCVSRKAKQKNFRFLN